MYLIGTIDPSNIWMLTSLEWCAHWFKYMYAIKCSTGSGDVDTSKVVKADADGAIVGASGWWDGV